MLSCPYSFLHVKTLEAIMATAQSTIWFPGWASKKSRATQEEESRTFVREDIWRLLKGNSTISLSLYTLGAAGILNEKKGSVNILMKSEKIRLDGSHRYIFERATLSSLSPSLTPSLSPSLSPPPSLSLSLSLSVSPHSCFYSLVAAVILIENNFLMRRACREN